MIDCSHTALPMTPTEAWRTASRHKHYCLVYEVDTALGVFGLIRTPSSAVLHNGRNPPLLGKRRP